MRLINADKLRDEWLYGTDGNEPEFTPNDVLESIDNQPTVVPGKNVTADEMFRELGYHPGMKCQIRWLYQKAENGQLYDIVIDAKKIWKEWVDVMCPCNRSDATKWTPEELLAAAQAIREMEAQKDG